MEIKILSRKALEMLSAKPFDQKTAVISITDIDGEQVRLLNQPRFILRISFNDVDNDIFFDDPTHKVVEKEFFLDGIPHGETDKERLAIEKKYGMITDEQADEIALFCYETINHVDCLICQCEHGQSRSAAVAAAITEFKDKKGIKVFASDDYCPNKVVFRKVFDSVSSICFNSTEEQFLRFQLGLDNGICLSLEQVADKMHLDRDRVKLLEKNTIMKAKRVEIIRKRLSEASNFLLSAKAVIIGHAVGDALGVPVEFTEREKLEKNPVTDMQGYGTFNMSEGAWSDDTSMSLCALDTLIGEKINFDSIMINFGKWYYKDEFTPTGEAFDIGKTCGSAINNYFFCKKSWRECGLSDEQSNGNGSLMRINPFVLYTYRLDTNTKTKIEIIELASAMTHAHSRSKVGCGIYAFVLWKLLKNPCKESISAGLAQAEEFYRNSAEYAYYVKTFSFANADKLKHIGSNEIRSSGYIVDSLEAALWCLLTTDSYKECVLKAVNLGYDADTIAAIAGGLAGALYGYEAIPQKWRDCLIKREYIEELCERAFKNTRQY